MKQGRAVRASTIAVMSRALVVAGMLAAALALTSCGQPLAGAPTPPPKTPAIPLADKVAPPEEGAWLGVFRPPAPFEIRVFDEYKQVSEKRPAILMWYQTWDRRADWEFDTRACVSTYQRGAVPLITWEPWYSGANARFVDDPAAQPEYQLSDIIDGRYDKHITDYARAVKALGGPVMIRPMHEMNGSWYPWGGTVNGNDPQEFVRAWRHVHAIFAKVGATNVTWVWSVNWMSAPDTPENSFSVYYPGDAYVDWIGLSGFNWGSSASNQEWLTFNRIYEGPLEYLATLDKPIMLAEFASAPDGGDKAKWIADAYRKMRKEHPEIKAAVYYDALERRPNDTQDWRIDRPEAVASAFQEAVAHPYFLPGPVPELQAWLDELTPEAQRFLRGVDPGER